MIGLGRAEMHDLWLVEIAPGDREGFVDEHAGTNARLPIFHQHVVFNAVKRSDVEADVNTRIFKSAFEPGRRATRSSIKM